MTANAKPQLQNPTLSSVTISRSTSRISVPHYVNFPEVKWHKILISKGCCVARRCVSDGTARPGKNLPKVKKSCRNHLKLPTNFPTEPLENILDAVAGHLLDILLIFRLVNKSG